MKRVGLVLASLCMIVLVSGCGGKEKKLECTMSIDESGMKVKQVFTLNFDKKDQYKSGSLKQDNTISEDLLKVADLGTYKTSIENTILKQQFKGMKYELTDNGKDTITFDISITEKDMQTATGAKNLTGSDDAKKELENLGYTCKVN